jgi:hypothetical protein
MAARYAKLTIRAAWSFNDRTRGEQAKEVRFKLGGQWVIYRLGANPDRNEFVAPDPNDIEPFPGRTFVLEGITNLLALVKKTILTRGLPYQVSAPRDAGDDASHFNPSQGETAGWPIVEFDIRPAL